MSSASLRVDQARGEVRAIEIITTPSGLWVICYVMESSASDGDHYRAYPSDEYENATGIIALNADDCDTVIQAARSEHPI